MLDASYMPARTEWVLGDIAMRKRQFILTRENPYSSMLICGREDDYSSSPQLDPGVPY
jgi:hypothetical protein